MLLKFNRYFIPASGMFCLGAAGWEVYHSNFGLAAIDFALAAVNFYMARKYWRKCSS